MLLLDVLCVGHATYDVTMQVARHPGPDDKLQAEAMDLAGGGPAANAAVQAARLGSRAGFCGYLGRDLFGDAHLAELKAENVDTSLVVRGDAATPVSQVLAKPDGLRSVVNFKGNTPWLEADVMNLLPAKVVLFDGHEPVLSDVFCEQLSHTDTITLLDAGSLHRGTRALAGNVDVLAASEKFARQWCGSDDMESALDKLALVNDCIVITRGAKGLIWQRHGERGQSPAFRVQAVDSTGAGDAFHGALAHALATDMAWEEALRFASAAAALTCARLGARRALPDAAAVQELLGKA